MVTGMAIGILVELWFPGGRTVAGGKPLPEDEKGMKYWIKSKLKALMMLIWRLCMKAAEALSGIIGVIIS